MNRVSDFSNPNQPLLNSGTGGAGAAMTSNSVEEAAIKKRKYIKYGIIGGIGLIVLVLAIVLPLVLIHHDTPVPPNPPLPGGASNPYLNVPNSIMSTTAGTRVTGKLKISGVNTTSGTFLESVHAAIP